MKTDLKKVFQIAADEGYRDYLPLGILGEGDPYKKVKKITAEAKKALTNVEP
jgi:hypothetical protein